MECKKQPSRIGVVKHPRMADYTERSSREQTKPDGVEKSSDDYRPAFNDYQQTSHIGLYTAGRLDYL